MEMMNKTRQMISLNGDTYQHIQNYIIEQKWDILAVRLPTFVTGPDMSKRKNEI
jgi:hypothetical protein